MATPVELIFRLSGLSTIVGGLNTVGSSLEQVGARARSAGRELEATGRSMRNFGAGLTAFVSAPLAAAGAGLVAMAAQAEESENLFEVSMGNMGEAARAFSEDLSSSLGLNAFELRRQIGVMQNFTTAMGISEDAAYGLSTGMTELAADMASFFNISTDDAFQRIQAGLAGETESLRRMGIVINETAIRQRALSMGVIEGSEALSEQQKVILRGILILEQTENAQGDLARTMDSVTNQMRVIASTATEMAIRFGSTLLPTVQNVFRYVSGTVLPVIESWIEAWESLSERTRGFIIMGILAVAAIGPLIAIIGVGIQVVGALTVAFGFLAGAVGFLLSPVGLIVAAVAGLAAVVFFARDSFDNFGEAMRSILGAAGATITAWAEGAKDMFLGVAIAGANMVANLSGFFDQIAQWVGGMLTTVGNAVGTVNEAAGNALRSAGAGLQQLSSNLAGAAEGFVQTLRVEQRDAQTAAEEAARMARDLLAEAGVELALGAQDFGSNIQGTIDMVRGLLTQGADFLGGVTQDIEGSTDAAGSAVEGLQEQLEALLGTMEGVASGGSSDGPSSISEVFQEWSEGMQDMQALGIETAEGLTAAFDGFTKSFSQGVGNAFAQAIVYGESLGKALEDVAKKSLAQLIGALIQLGVQFVINATLGQALAGAAAAAAQLFGRAVAAAWSSAAAMVSLATFGANAAPATAALASTTAFARGLASFQRGTDSFTATGARLIMVGENGPERVSVTPLGAGSPGGAGNVNVFIPEGAIFDEISFERVAERIGDVVMQRLQRGTV